MIRTGDLYKFYKTGKPDVLKKFIRSNKIQMNNNGTDSCTLNTMIRIMLNENLSSFNLEFIQTLVDHGSEPFNGTGMYNTMRYTLMLCEQYLIRTLRDDQVRAEQNLINLINLLTNSGSEFHVSKCDATNDIFLAAIGTKNDIILAAIGTKNIKIIELIYDRFAIDLADLCCQTSHDYSWNHYYCHNPLTCAVKTKNIEIVKIVHQCGAKPCLSDGWCNTLLQAIMSADPEIVREIVMIGGYMEKYNGAHLSIDLYWPEGNRTNEILDLIMCSGSKIKLKHFRFQTRMRMLHYFRLMNQDSSAIDADDPELTNLEEQNINELRIHLKSVMDQLFKQWTERKKESKLLLMGTPLPECCVDMITEYQDQGQGIRYIDWLKH